MSKSWIPWTRIGFTDEELKHLKENPIKTTCGVCNKDTTHINICNIDDLNKIRSECPSESCPYKGDLGW